MLLAIGDKGNARVSKSEKFLAVQSAEINRDGGLLRSSSKLPLGVKKRVAQIKVPADGAHSNSKTGGIAK
jgi:hypothetical protein